MCVYTCVHTCVSVHTCVPCVCIYVHVCVDTCVCVWILVCVCAYLCVHTVHTRIKFQRISVALEHSIGSVWFVHAIRSSYGTHKPYASKDFFNATVFRSTLRKTL